MRNDASTSPAKCESLENSGAVTASNVSHDRSLGGTRETLLGFARHDDLKAVSSRQSGIIEVPSTFEEPSIISSNIPAVENVYSNMLIASNNALWNTNSQAQSRTDIIKKDLVQSRVSNKLLISENGGPSETKNQASQS